MKRIITIILAIAMCAAILPGCAPGDVELYNALERSDAAESYTAVTTLGFKLDVTRPITALTEPENDSYYSYRSNADMAAESNEELANYSELGERLTVKAVTTKGGGNTKMDVTLAMPDAEADFTLWQQGENRLIFKVPTMITPLIYNAAKGKQYLYANVNELAAMISEGEVMPQVSNDLANKLKDAFTSKLTYPLVTDTALQGDATVYTVKLDAAALKGLTENSLSVLAEPETVSLIATIVYLMDTDSSATIEELKADISDGLEIFKDDAVEFFAAIEASGLLKDGLTLRFYVKDGLVSRREVELKVYPDAAKLASAFGDGELDFDGAYSVTVNAVTDFTYGGEAVEVPALTAENSIDLGAEYAAYMAYQNAYDDWRESMLYGWGNYHPSTEYVLERSADTPITLRNLENGKEVTITPGIVVADNTVWQYGIAMPVVEMLSVVDGVSISWNPTTMGVEVRHPYISRYYASEDEEEILFLPNANGVEYVREYWANSEYSYYPYYTREYTGDVLSDEIVNTLQDYDDIFFEDYYGYAADGTLLGYSPYYDENGKVYADFDDVFDALGYVCKLEGNVLSIHRADASFSYEGIENNFFYIMNDDYYYYDYYYYY